ncbi:MAG TPA: exosortase system-associated protein, TIGR04073 family [Verrucomicrobiae bacterium]|jgi:putative exosortase-associated protein (TIGR04073 family)
MRKLIFLFAAIATTVGLAGCKGPEQKLSRGLDNTFEIVRWGDLRHDVEQDAVFSSPDVSYSHGVIRGFDQSISRIGLGIYEVATFPIPSYKPVCTNYLPVNPQYPDSYRPGVVSSSTFDTDTYTGFSGGDVAPMVPGSRFQIFDN